MAQSHNKFSKSEYKYVIIQHISGLTYYRVNIKGVSKTSYKTEREAAIAADKYLIGKGKEPVNILIRK